MVSSKKRKKEKVEGNCFVNGFFEEKVKVEGK